MDAPRDVPAPANPDWRTPLSWLFGLLLLATVVLVASQFTQIERFAAIARAAQPAWLLVALVFQALTYPCAAGVWHTTLRRAGVHERFWSIVPLGLAKLFTDQALPSGGIGGTLLVVSGLARRGIPQGVAMAALLVGLVSYYVAYLIAALTALFILNRSHTLNHLMTGAVLVFTLVAVGIPVIVLSFRRLSQRTSGEGPGRPTYRWIARLPGFSALTSALASAPGALLRDRPSLVITLLLQVLIVVLDAGTLWAMLQALGVAGTPETALAAFVMASLAATIGPMPLGLGTFEAVCVTVLHLQGYALEAALMATLLLRGVTFWLPMIPGLAIARRELNRPGLAPSGTGRASVHTAKGHCNE